MKSRFHEAADAELTEAVMYYDGKASGLGDRFLTEIKAATRFPYSLMYVVEPEELFVVAVAHQSKRPAYWADRIPERSGG